jgi:hypothetical protein
MGQETTMKKRSGTDETDLEQLELSLAEVDADEDDEDDDE